MIIKSFAIAYCAAVVAFLIIDGIWLGIVAKNFYAQHFGDLLRERILPLPALAFYLLYTSGLVFLAVRPGQSDIGIANVALYGAIVGFLSYGTYNFTNLATLRDWPWIVSVVDLAWGTVLSATVAAISAIALRQFS